MCTGILVNRPEEQASAHYIVIIQITILQKIVALKDTCLCGKTLFLHA